MASNSSYPTLSINDVTDFVRRSCLLDNKVSLAKMDQIMIATNVSNNTFKKSAERELHRYEFIEFVVRLALAAYKDTKKVETIEEAIEKICQEDIFPSNSKCESKSFRKEHMFSYDVN